MIQRTTFGCLLLSLLVVSSYAEIKSSQEEYQLEFSNWMVTHSKAYDGSEELFRRFKIFSDNLDMIREHNAGNHTYTLGINAFSDLTTAEWASTMFGSLPGEPDMEPIHDDKVYVDVIASGFDWSKKGAVTPVKNQDPCGSCWSFSTTGGVEGAYAIKHNSLQSFSEQQLIDCMPGETCNSGGSIGDALETIKKKGSCLEKDYKYIAKDESCKKSCAPATYVSSYSYITGEDTYMNKIATGPISISLGTSDKFHHYAGGVFNDASCKTRGHDVLIVGYGADSGKNYWTIKNSWGTSWGERGYIRIQRGEKMCGIGHKGYLPQV